MTKGTRILWTSLGRMHRALFLSSSNPSLKAVVRNSFGRSRVMAAAKATHPSKSQPSVSIDLQKLLHTLTYTEVLFWSVSFCVKKATLSFQRFTNSIQVRSWTFYIRQLNTEASQDLFFANGGPKFVRWHQPLDSIKILERFQSGQKSALPLKQPQNRISEATEFYVYELFWRQKFNEKKSSVHSVK